MKLVIAEKPSVAQSLAAVIGATTRKDGYLEGNGWRVSWCVGHLAGLAPADYYDPKYAKWKYDDLPILPEKWKMVVGKDKKSQFDVLKKLMNESDVTEVVNACDAGREGELIFRNAYYLAGCKKPMLRLWISSMEDVAIQEGFQQLQPGPAWMWKMKVPSKPPSPACSGVRRCWSLPIGCAPWPEPTTSWFWRTAMWPSRAPRRS